MPQQIYFFTGVSKWAKLKKPDKYNKYTIDLYLDKPSLDAFKKSGIQVKTKANEEGVFVTFKRDHVKLIKEKEAVFGPPTVLINSGETTEEGKVIYNDFDGLVGNGSEVTVKVVVYEGARGKGHRLEAVAVETLVPFEGGTQDDDLPF